MNAIHDMTHGSVQEPKPVRVTVSGKVKLPDVAVAVHTDHSLVRGRGGQVSLEPATSLTEAVEAEVLVPDPRPVPQREEVCGQPGPEGGLRRGHGRCLRGVRVHQAGGGLHHRGAAVLVRGEHLGCDLLHQRGSAHNPLSAGGAVPHLWPGLAWLTHRVTLSRCHHHHQMSWGHSYLGTLPDVDRGPHLLEADWTLQLVAGNESRLISAKLSPHSPNVHLAQSVLLLDHGALDVVDEGLRLLEPLTGLAIRNLSFPLLLLFELLLLNLHPHLELPPLPLLASLEVLVIFEQFLF